MSKRLLPKDCEIERTGSDCFRLWFHRAWGEPYISAEYDREKGERFKRAAYRICVRFNWIDNPPNKPIPPNAVVVRRGTP